MTSSWRCLLLLGAAWHASAQLTDPTSKDNSPNCQCYFVSGPDSGFFQYHRFFDFRSIAADGSNNYTTAPAVVSSNQNTGQDPVTSSFFSSNTWTRDWAITQDVERTNAPYRIVNSPRNIYISRNTTNGGSTFLTMRTARLQNFQSTAEFSSKQNNILHGSLRARMRVVPNGLSNASAPSVGSHPVNNPSKGSRPSKPVDDGAVAAFFTYLNDTQETDIEILTTEPTQYIHYTNQPDYNETTDEEIPGAGTNASLPGGVGYTDWIEHRIDWFDNLTRWYVNGQLVLNKTKNAPNSPTALFLNLWSSGGSWSGVMQPGGQVTMAVEWIQMAFNVSGPLRDDGDSSKRDVGVDADGLFARAANTKCTAACNVDGVQKTGFPEKAPSSVGKASGPNGTAALAPVP